MPVLLFALFAAAGGAVAYYRSRNQDGVVTSELNIPYRWRVQGGWSGSFWSWWVPPGRPEVQVGEFTSFADAKASALAEIAAAMGGPGGELIVGIPAQSVGKAKFLDQ